MKIMTDLLPSTETIMFFCFSCLNNIIDFIFSPYEYLIEKEKEKIITHEEKNEIMRKRLCKYKTHIEKYVLLDTYQKIREIILQSKRCTKYINQIEKNTAEKDNLFLDLEDRTAYFAVKNYFYQEKIKIIYEDINFDPFRVGDLMVVQSGRDFDIVADYCIFLHNEDVLMEKYIKYNQIYQLLCFSYTRQIKLPWDLIRMLCSFLN